MSMPAPGDGVVRPAARRPDAGRMRRSWVIQPRGGSGRAPARGAPGGSPERREHAGFTLIEVAVVLFLLAIAAAVALPALNRGTDALRTRTEIAGFCSFLRHAREQAVTRREPQQVDVDPQAHLLVLRSGGSPTPTASRRLWPALRVEPETPAALTVRFFPTGPASAAAYRISGPAQRVWVITVDPLTGRVTNRPAES